MNVKVNDILKQKIEMELGSSVDGFVPLPIGTEWIVVSINDRYNTCNLKLVNGLDESKNGGTISLEGLEEYYELVGEN